MFYFHPQKGLQRVPRSGRFSAHEQWVNAKYPEVAWCFANMLRGTYWVDTIRRTVKIVLYDNVETKAVQFRELTNAIATDFPAYLQTALYATAGAGGLDIQSIRTVGLELR